MSGPPEHAGSPEGTSEQKETGNGTTIPTIHAKSACGPAAWYWPAAHLGAPVLAQAKSRPSTEPAFPKLFARYTGLNGTKPRHSRPDRRQPGLRDSPKVGSNAQGDAARPSRIRPSDRALQLVRAGLDKP